MNKGNLKKSIREHIEKKSLSDNKLESLLMLQDEQVNGASHFSRMQLRWIAAAAVFFIVIGNLFYFSIVSDLALDQRIGNEVARNHIKLKPIEIHTSSIEVVRNFLTELDFSPIDSRLLKGSAKKLIGGRYCSIQGVTAVQLRLKDSVTGQVHSLYQTVYDSKVFSGLPKLKENQKPVTIYSKGLAVDIWIEKGLLFALTHDTSK